MDVTTILMFAMVATLFCVCAVGMGAALYFLQKFLSPEPSFMQQRLMRLKSQHREETSSIYQNEARKISQLFKDRNYANEALGKFLENYSFTELIKRSLYQAGLTIPVDKFILYFLVGPFLGGFLLFMLSKNFVIFLLGLIVPLLSFGALKFRQGKRLARFTTQLPDALNLITSSLRAGHSFQSAIGVVASEMPDPIGVEFALVVNDINLGIPVKEAMAKLVANLDLPDVRMFSTAVLIQREAGGNLAEVLDKLGYTIRERFKLKGQISALTGQSRLTGYVLGCAPVGLFVILFLLFPAYVEPLYTTTLGMFGLGVAGVLQLIGFFIMKKIIDIRV
jgi:tight adherence protein B